MDLSFEVDDFTLLSDLGLSRIQAKIYLALLKLGIDSKAVSIFKYSGVARQDVYRVLCELQQIGIVEKIISKPVRFRAIEPKKAVALLLEKKKNTFTDLNKKAEIFVQRATVIHAKKYFSHEKDSLLLISEKHALIKKCQEEIEKVTKSVEIISPSKEFTKWVTTLNEAFGLAKSRGVQIRWLIDKPLDQELKTIQYLVSENPAFNIKYTEKNLQVKFGIYDGKTSICSIFKEGDFAETPVLWSNSTMIIELAKSYFESHWNKAIQLTPQNKC